jgi:uncharacterized protein (DUF488 family)
MAIQLTTIGFTRKSAEEFFRLLIEAGVRRVVDVRLNNTGQLAGFSKRDDLAYFLRTIAGIDYVHVPELAPTQAMLDRFKKHGVDWRDYEREFLQLVADRRIEETIPSELLDGACLLCSEDRPEHCHRRLVAEYLAKKWGEVELRHLR